MNNTNTPTREAIVLGPNGTPLLDMDPAMLPVDVDGLVDTWDPRTLAFLDAAYTFEGMLPGADTISVVWSDTNTHVHGLCSGCDDIFTVADGQDVTVDRSDVVVCGDCAASMDDDH